MMPSLHMVALDVGTIVGDASSVKVYTIGGALVCSNVDSTSCTTGVYIMVIDGVIHKVIVR